jgi:hypothetical protein
LYSVLHEFSAGLLVLRLEETAIGAAVGFIVAVVVTPLSTRDTVRAARNNLLTALAALLGAVADRVGGAAEPGQDIDGLSRSLDNDLRQLAIVARPLTRPLLWGNSPPRTRRRLALFAALTTHARQLAVATRRPTACPVEGPAAACRALATAATLLTEAPIGQGQAAAAESLAIADAALFARTDAAPGTRATDPVLHALIQIQDVLCELTGTPAQPCRSGDGGPGYGPLPTLAPAGQSTTSRS